MFLKEKSSNQLVQILDLADLFNPRQAELAGRHHIGGKAQDPERFRKTDLSFPSGEELPRCWTDPGYRDDELRK